MNDDPDVDDDTVLEQLDDADMLTDPRVDPLDEGYSPPEKPRGLDAWGTTESEEREGEPLDERLRHEEPPTRWSDIGTPGDGVGDTRDTDGELYDDEVGTRRAGRLVADVGEDSWAADVGIDGAGASAEEAAVHVVDGPD